MITEGFWSGVGSGANWVAGKGIDVGIDASVGATKLGAKATGKVVKGVGNISYSIANTKLGGAALAAGTGLYLARKYFNKRERDQDKSDGINVKTKTKSKKKNRKQPNWLKEQSILIQETNKNIPGYSKPPNLTGQSPNLTTQPRMIGLGRNPRSVVANLGRRKLNNYKTDAEFKHVDLQRRQARANMKKTKADTGTDRVIGKLSA